MVRTTGNDRKSKENQIPFCGEAADAGTAAPTYASV